MYDPDEKMRIITIEWKKPYVYSGESMTLFQRVMRAIFSDIEAPIGGEAKLTISYEMTDEAGNYFDVTLGPAISLTDESGFKTLPKELYSELYNQMRAKFLFCLRRSYVYTISN